jgi:hypothetical protein
MDGGNSKVGNLQLSAIIFTTKPSRFSCGKKGNPATPLHEFKEPFKKLFSSQNAFLIISERRKREKKNSLSSRKKHKFSILLYTFLSDFILALSLSLVFRKIFFGKRTLQSS